MDIEQLLTKFEEIFEESSFEFKSIFETNQIDVCMNSEESEKTKERMKLNRSVLNDFLFDHLEEQINNGIFESLKEEKN